MSAEDMNTGDMNTGDMSTRDMSTLERRYRRIIRCLPKAYRADRAEEMLTALLDGAAPGRTRPKVGEVFSLGALAVRLRFGAPGASARGQLAGDVVRRAVLVRLMAGTVLSASTFAFFIVHVAAASTLALLGYDLLQPVLFLALLFGWRRVGRTLSAVYLAITAYAAFEVFQIPDSSAGILDPVLTLLDIGLGVATMLAVFPAFHREAPRVGNRRWWLLVCLVPTVAIGCFSSLFMFRFQADDLLWPAFYVVAGVAAAGFAVAKFKTSPVWPFALAVGTWPLIISGFEGVFFPFRQADAIVVGATCAAEAVVVAAALASLMYRRRLILA